MLPLSVHCYSHHFAEARFLLIIHFFIHFSKSWANKPLPPPYPPPTTSEKWRHSAPHLHLKFKHLFMNLSGSFFFAFSYPLCLSLSPCLSVYVSICSSAVHTPAELMICFCRLFSTSNILKLFRSKKNKVGNNTWSRHGWTSLGPLLCSGKLKYYLSTLAQLLGLPLEYLCISQYIYKGKHPIFFL